MPCRHASETGRTRIAGCDVPARLNGLFADTLPQQEIRVVEIIEKLGEKPVTVCGAGFLNSLEHTADHTFRVAGRSRGAGCDVPARLNGLFADTLPQQEIRVVEILEKLGEERVTVCGDGFLNPLEHTAVNTFRVVRRLQQEGRDRRDKYRLAHSLRSIFPYVARHLAASHGKTGQREIT